MIQIAAIFPALILSGCDYPSPETAQAPGAASLSREAAVADIRWLEPKAGVSPQLWLASRELARDAREDEPAVVEFSAILAEADRRYYEGPRMIANRAVQIEEMLAENGVKESARSVIKSLTDIGEPEGRAGFGETCQHYVTARIQGATRAAALDTLRRDGLPAPAGGEDRQ